MNTNGALGQAMGAPLIVQAALVGHVHPKMAAQASRAGAGFEDHTNAVENRVGAQKVTSEGDDQVWVPVTEEFLPEPA